VRCLIIQNRIGLEGRTRCVAEFVRLLNDLGEEPTIACLVFDDPDIGRPFGISGLRYRLSTLAPWPSVPSAHRPEVLVTNLLARRMIEQLAPDLVFNSNNTWAFLPVGPRYIHYIHFPFKASLRYMSRFKGGLWKPYASFMKALVNEETPPPDSVFAANSEFVRARIEEMYSLDASVIHPPAWDGRLSPARPDLRRVMTLGSFHPDKDQLQQIEVARRMPDWHFALLGSPAAPRYARKVQREAERTPNVEVVLNPTKERLEHELSGASHFLHNNPDEGFGIAVVEAAAAGCVPIVPNTGGVREIVQTEKLRFGDVDECVDALRGSTGAPGRRLLAGVQQGLHRFASENFRSAMSRTIGVSLAQDEATQDVSAGT